MTIIHAMDDPVYLPRMLEKPLATALSRSPVVIVTGSRQTGKSTLVRRAPLARGRTYLTLDDIEILTRARGARLKS